MILPLTYFHALPIPPFSADTVARNGSSVLHSGDLIIVSVTNAVWRFYLIQAPVLHNMRHLVLKRIERSQLDAIPISSAISLNGHLVANIWPERHSIVCRTTEAARNSFVSWLLSNFPCPFPEWLEYAACNYAETMTGEITKQDDL